MFKKVITMFKKFLHKVYVTLFGEDSGPRAIEPTASTPEPVSYQRLDSWERFIMACAQLKTGGSTTKAVPVTYSFIRDKSSECDGPYSSHAKIKEGFDRLESLGYINREKKGGKSYLKVRQAISDPHEELGYSEVEWAAIMCTKT
jgi:hypothetical protein